MSDARTEAAVDAWDDWWRKNAVLRAGARENHERRCLGMEAALAAADAVGEPTVSDDQDWRGLADQLAAALEDLYWTTVDHNEHKARQFNSCGHERCVAAKNNARAVLARFHETQESATNG